MDLGLPSGVRDYLPDAAARLLSVTARLGEVFAAHGYRRVVVPTLEKAAVVGRGLDPEARERLFRCVEPGTGEVVALCPDHTAQVARMWAASLASLPPPVRVSYAGTVMRAREVRAGRAREVYQAGVECLGAAGPTADAEIVVLCARALGAAGVGEAVVDLGHAGFLRAFLEAAALPEAARTAVRDHLAHKDAPSLEAEVRALGPARGDAGRARSALPELATLYGQGTLDRARRLARRAGVGALALDEVDTVLGTLAAVDLPARITVDLGESRGFAYYTGLTVHAFARGAGSEIAAGGRYDDLLGRYGRPAPAVGVAFDIPFLLDALGNGVPDPAGVVLAAGDLQAAEALRVADALRAPGRPVVFLEGRRTEAEVLAFARAHGHAEAVLPVSGPGGPGRFARIRVADGARRTGPLSALATPLAPPAAP